MPEGEKTEENVLRVRNEFVPYYDIHNADDSRPYPGISALLSYLQSAGIQIAVASNKYQAATEKFIDAIAYHEVVFFYYMSGVS